MKTFMLTLLIAIAHMIMLSNFRVVSGMSVKKINIEEEDPTSFIEMRSAGEGITKCEDVCHADDFIQPE